jgi:hypothetical protein
MNYNTVIGSAKAIVDGKETYLSRCTPIDPLPQCEHCIRQDVRLPPLLEYSAAKCWGVGPCLFITGENIKRSK